MHELKSPRKIKFSNLDGSESILLERESRCDSKQPCFGLKNITIYITLNRKF